VYKVQPFERMVGHDAAKEMDAAVFACVALDGGGGVDNVQFVGVGGDGELVGGDYANDREEGAGRFPALGAAAGVVVCDVAGQCDFDFVGGALAVELSALEVGVAFDDAVVDCGVNRRHDERLRDVIKVVFEVVVSRGGMF
jgi:hypothetical protein